jgi:hypothetical protein
MDVDGVGIATVGTVLWGLAGLGLAPFAGWLADHDATWWLWTCLAGALLGLYGCWSTRRRRSRLRGLAAAAPVATEKVVEKESEAPPV